MRYSPRAFETWVDPLRTLSTADEREVLFQFLTLDQAFRDQPVLLRRLSDRSLSVDIRLAWLMQAFGVIAPTKGLQVIKQLLIDEALAQWSHFFHDYVRFRERRGSGRVYLLKSQMELSEEEQRQVQVYLEERFSQPAALFSMIDPTLKAGMRIESLDGWMLDASLAGRLNRLVSSLA